MIDAAVKEVLSRESSAALVTAGNEGPHLVATWNSYIRVMDENTLMFPAGGMKKTQSNIEAGSPVQLIIGSRDAAGKGLGFRLTGKAAVEAGTPAHEQLKQEYKWCRAAVVLQVEKVEKVLG